LKTFCAPWQQDKQMSFHCISNRDVNEGLESFVKDKNIDILAMLSHRKSWFEELFQLNRAKQMSYQHSIPLLVYQMENLT
jgi:hypothetical protein